MKKIILLILLIAGFLLIGFKKQSTMKISDKSNFLKPSASITKKLTITNGPSLESQTISHSLFFPYWTLPENADFPLPATDQNHTPDTLIYFGITADQNGVDQNEVGYKRLTDFVRLTEDQTAKKILTVRLINSEINEKILASNKLQQKIINEAIAIAKQFKFNGLLYDFELKALPIDSVKSQITNLYKTAADRSKMAGLNFSITIYGDVFYRARPYDIENIAPLVDHIYIMAYDFHKSFGTPGPNFPLNKNDKYGYDFVSMVSDFKKVTQKDKLTVVFGLYGYDWSVDEQNRPLKPAQALTLAQIQNRFVPCNEINCQITNDKNSLETNIVYNDESGQKHSLWYENTISVEKKISVLKRHDITRVAYWAFGYY